MFEQAFKNIDDILRKESGAERLLCARSGHSVTQYKNSIDFQVRVNNCRLYKHI